MGLLDAHSRVVAAQYTRPRIAVAFFLPDSDDASTVALSDLEDPRSIPVFLEALKDRNPDIRKTAIHALGEMEVAAAVEPLIAAKICSKCTGLVHFGVRVCPFSTRV